MKTSAVSSTTQPFSALRPTTFFGARRSVLRGFVVLLALGLPAAGLHAEAGWFSKKSSKRALSPASFKLESELIAQIPDVRAALTYAKANPNDSDAWRTLGHVLSDNAGGDDATKAFHIATRIDPRSPDAWSDLGASLLRQGETKKAISALKEAVEIEPLHARAHYNLGLALQARGRYDKALEALERALLIDEGLGDPVTNPSSINNPDIDIIRLRVYLKTVGASPSVYVR